MMNSPRYANHNRRSIRLPNYDYSLSGFYFVTICTKDRECLFGNVVNCRMILSNIGIIVKRFWNEIPVHYPNVALGAFVVMPNHVHGIIQLNGVDGIVGVQDSEPLQDGRLKNNPLQINKYQHIIPRSLGAIIRGYKIGVTKYCRQNGLKKIVWQRNYYESIIRNETALIKIQNYIENNPNAEEKI